jgi:L-lactate dehydrogenase complex protein LldG
MTRTSDARADILRSIHDNLAASVPYDAVVHLGPPTAHAPAPGQRAPLPLATALATEAPSRATNDDPVQRFIEQATGVGASCEIVRGESEAAAAVTRALSAARARHVVASDAPLVKRVLAAVPSAFAVEEIEGLPRDDLFACDAGITTAQLGIAESGTLVLESAREKNRLLSLVPPIHIALLGAGDICDSMSDVIARLEQNFASHAVIFITGPSRTSDIELTLTIGVHGPRMLHIIILEGHA